MTVGKAVRSMNRECAEYPAHVAEPARTKGRMPTEPAAEAVPEKAFNGPPLAPANNPRPTTVAARSRRAEPPSAALKGGCGRGDRVSSSCPGFRLRHGFGGPTPRTRRSLSVDGCSGHPRLFIRHVSG